MSKTADHYLELEERLKQGYVYVIYPADAEPLFTRTIGACITYARDLHGDQVANIRRIQDVINEMTEEAYDRAYQKGW